jgi:hypothetical protein
MIQIHQYYMGQKHHEGGRMQRELAFSLCPFDHGVLLSLLLFFESPLTKPIHLWYFGLDIRRSYFSRVTTSISMAPLYELMPIFLVLPGFCVRFYTCSLVIFFGSFLCAPQRNFKSISFISFGYVYFAHCVCPIYIYSIIYEIPSQYQPAFWLYNSLSFD